MEYIRTIFATLIGLATAGINYAMGLVELPAEIEAGIITIVVAGVTFGVGKLIALVGANSA